MKKNNVYPDGLLRTDPFLETSGDNHTPLATKYYLPENFEQFSELVTAYKSDNFIRTNSNFFFTSISRSCITYLILLLKVKICDLSTWDTDHIVEMNSVFSDPNILENIFSMY